MFQPQVMPTTAKFDPWNEQPEVDPTDPWRPGKDMNASQGNAPAIAIPGAGNPPPLAPGGGEAMDAGYSGPVPQFTGSMGAGGGMKPMPMGGGGASIKPMGGMPHPMGDQSAMLRQLLLRKMGGGQ